MNKDPDIPTCIMIDRAFLVGLKLGAMLQGDSEKLEAIIDRARNDIRKAKQEAIK